MVSGTESNKTAALKPQARSRVTNGRALFAQPGVDGRTIWARRFRDLVQAYGDALGGLGVLDPVQVGLVRRAAALAVAAEKLERKLAIGELVDVETLAKLSGHYTRAIEGLGLSPLKPKQAIDSDATLDDIIARRRGPGRPRKAP